MSGSGSIEAVVASVPGLEMCSGTGGDSCTVGTAATSVSALVSTGGGSGDDGSDGG